MLLNLLLRTCLKVLFVENIGLTNDLLFFFFFLDGKTVTFDKWKEFVNMASLDEILKLLLQQKI